MIKKINRHLWHIIVICISLYLIISLLGIWEKNYNINKFNNAYLDYWSCSNNPLNCNFNLSELNINKSNKNTFAFSGNITKDFVEYEKLYYEVTFRTKIKKPIIIILISYLMIYMLILLNKLWIENLEKKWGITQEMLYKLRDKNAEQSRENN